MEGIKVKVCGMKNPENIRELLELQPDFMGFIFYQKSKRFAEPELDQELLLQFPERTKKVAVFVDEEEDKIMEIVKKYDIKMIQLHGHESPAFCETLRRKGLTIIKVFSVGEAFDFKKLEPYLLHTDYFLFDTKGKEYGGNGVTFDWSILKEYKYDKPIFLSGGIGTENVTSIKDLKIPVYAIDVNSKYETEPGVKNISLLKESIFNEA